MTRHMTQVVRTAIDELLEAAEPFEKVSRAFGANWNRNAPVKSQTGLGRLPTVHEYEELSEKAATLRGLMEYAA